MDQAVVGNFITRGWRNVREAGVARLMFTGVVIMIAVLIARFSWYMPLTDFAERGLYDMRSYAFAVLASVYVPGLTVAAPSMVSPEGFHERRVREASRSAPSRWFPVACDLRKGRTDPPARVRRSLLRRNQPKA